MTPEAKAKSLRILVMADTHDHMPPRFNELVAGVDEIWHLGDFCDPSLLAEIEAAGRPVTLVRGNCDAEMEWPLVVLLKRNGICFRLVHIPPNSPPKQTDVLLHGHTHVPRDEKVGEVRFLNPGCVTRPNRGAPASVAYLGIAADGKLTWELKMIR